MAMENQKTIICNCFKKESKWKRENVLFVCKLFTKGPFKNDAIEKSVIFEPLPALSLFVTNISNSTSSPLLSPTKKWQSVSR